MSSFVTRLKNKIPKIHFASNPCRIKFFDQEIVIFREDIMSKMLRNMIGTKSEISSADLKRYVRRDKAFFCVSVIHTEIINLACSNHTGSDAFVSFGFEYSTCFGGL
jgi:hypothetical protein